MEGAPDLLTRPTLGPGEAPAARARRRRTHPLLGPTLATALLLAASAVLAPRVGLAAWTLLPVVVVAVIVAGLLGSLADAPPGRFERRLSAYAAVMAWVWRALLVYGIGLGLFFGTIWLFD